MSSHPSHGTPRRCFKAVITVDIWHIRTQFSLWRALIYSKTINYLHHVWCTDVWLMVFLILSSISFIFLIFFNYFLDNDIRKPIAKPLLSIFGLTWPCCIICIKWIQTSQIIFWLFFMLYLSLAWILFFFLTFNLKFKSLKQGQHLFMLSDTPDFRSTT